MLPQRITRYWPIDGICPALFFGMLLASADYLMDIAVDYLRHERFKNNPV